MRELIIANHTFQHRVDDILQVVARLAPDTVAASAPVTAGEAA